MATRIFDHGPENPVVEHQTNYASDYAFGLIAMFETGDLKVVVGGLVLADASHKFYPWEKVSVVLAASLRAVFSVSRRQPRLRITTAMPTNQKALRLKNAGSVKVRPA